MGWGDYGGGQSAASAASGAGHFGGATAMGGPNIPGIYGGNLSFEEWKKRQGLQRGQYDQRHAWEMWQQYNQSQSQLRARYGAGQERVPEPELEPEREDVGSSPGFEKVQRFLRQQRATGRVISPEQIRYAWGAYWDKWAGKQAERERIGIERERLELEEERFAWQRGITKEQLEREEQAAMAGGMSMIGMGVGFAVGGPVGGIIGGTIGGMIGGSW